MLLQWIALVLAVLPFSSASLHTVFTTECTPYFTWQSLGFMLSWELSRQPGNVTRLMSCTEEGRRHWKDDGIMPTHMAPSWTVHPRTGDVYSGINKPVAVMDWLQKVQPQEDYILILDADMIMLKPFDPVKMGVLPGWGVSAFYGYLQGVNNELALKHVPLVAPRNDSLAGPVGRRGDQVGGFTMMLRSDLERVAPLWIKYSEDVRADPDAWQTSGDHYVKGPGDKPWIAEMYGYSFGASAADVWHLTDHTAMLYPSYLPFTAAGVPNVMHYGLLFEILDAPYSFDKHWFQTFDALRCPPWEELAAGKRPQHGLLPAPPHPTSLKGEGEALLRDLLSVEVVATLNEALCQNYGRICPPSDQLHRQCDAVKGLFDAVRQAREEVLHEARLSNCTNLEAKCPVWARRGECGLNPGYMLRTCKAACGLCPPSPALPKRLRSSPAAQAREQGTGHAGVSGMQLADGAIKSAQQRSALTIAEAQLPRTVHSDSAGVSTGLTAAKEAPLNPEDALMEDPPALAYVGAQVDRLSPQVVRLLSGPANHSNSAGQLQVDLESASLQQPGQARAAEQVRVDEESAQLQQAGVQGAANQARVGAEAEHVQRQGEGGGELAQDRVDREVEQLQTQAQEGEEVVRSDSAVPSSAPPSGFSEAAKVERNASAWTRMAVREPAEKHAQAEAPLRGYRKFKRDMTLLGAKQEREKQEHLCTASPSLTYDEVRDCLEAIKQGRSWVSPQLLDVAGALHDASVEADEVVSVDDVGEGPKLPRRLEWLLHTRTGQGTLVIMVFLLLSILPRWKAKKSPLLKSYSRFD